MTTAAFWLLFLSAVAALILAAWLDMQLHAARKQHLDAEAELIEWRKLAAQLAKDGAQDAIDRAGWVVR